MIALYALIALFIAWIWIDYFLQVTIFGAKKWTELVLIFCAGAVSSLLVFFVPPLIFDGLTGNFGEDLGYSVVEIGLVEELVKLVPFLVAFLIVKSRLKNPMDYLLFACLAALGFSSLENIFYFENYGVGAIIGRSILSLLGHMCDSALAIYGIVLVRFHPKFRKNYVVIPLFIALAAISHGFYDFWLMFDGAEAYGWVITILYFLVTVSIFATILNNGLNNSTQFTFHKVVDGAHVLKRLILNYGILLGATFILTLIMKGEHGIEGFIFNFSYVAFIIVVCCIRLSRFKLIPKRWNPIKLELPFSIDFAPTEAQLSRSFHIRVKGESFNEARVNAFYGKQCHIYPIKKTGSTIKSRLVGTVKAKHFLENDTTYYEANIPGYLNDTVLFRPKTSGKTEVNETYPIVALMVPVDRVNWTGQARKKQAFKFVEWVYLVPILKEG